MVKVIKSPVPFNTKYYTHDVSLKVRGPEEDKAYTFIEGLRYNVRRGNTFLETAAGEVKSLRRGACKFFDLNKDFLDINLNKATEEVLEKGHKDKAELQVIRKVIFSDLEEFFKKEEGTVTIYNTNKANGENLQISFNKDLLAWVIASKNVSLMARTREDIELYSFDRYNFAKLIGNAWFDILDKMDANTLND